MRPTRSRTRGARWRQERGWLNGYFNIDKEEVSGAFLGEALGPTPVGAAATAGKAVSFIGKAAQITPNTFGYGRVFYSGGGAGSRAAALAKETGGVTIESTWLGAALNAITNQKTYPFLRGAWERLSKRYAEGAKGPVDVFLGKNVNTQGVWKTIEEKALIKNQTPITVHQ